jgi:hypothetical protein
MRECLEGLFSGAHVEPFGDAGEVLRAESNFERSCSLSSCLYVRS